MIKQSSAEPSRAREEAVAAEGGQWVSHNDLLLHPAHADRLIASGLDSLDAIFALPNDRQLSKPGLDPWRERIRTELGPAAGEGIVYIKRFLRPPGRAQRQVQRARCGARSLAGLEWHRLCEFASLGIPAATPLALGEELERNCEIRSAVVISAVRGRSLERRCQDRDWPDRATLRLLIPQLAEIVGRMHAAGLVHRDLYLGHIFLHTGDDSGPQTLGRDGFAGGTQMPNLLKEFELRLIDLQRVIRPEIFASRWFTKDLGQLNYSTPPQISRTDRLRFLYHYLRSRNGSIRAAKSASDLDGPDERILRSARKLCYRVLGKTAQIAAHDRSRRHRLMASTE